MRPKIRGKLNEAFRNTIGRQTKLISGEEMMESSEQHSGHPNLRYSCDLLTC